MRRRSRRDGSLCEAHLSGLTDGEDAEMDACPHEHENRVDVCEVSDADRAAMLREYLEAFVDEIDDEIDPDRAVRTF
ncbi:hypothetical protein ACFQPA_12850 [Halomarina halobia]|uniref:Uncharacterized protein n=1 Tax=Halomarina halobia TaxID=3033386 RepID=A0ABD6A8Z5_9EURY|nr:hypothetical protein [Halomarina sp. PSR21]